MQVDQAGMFQGALRLLQPLAGYRFALDPLLLAASLRSGRQRRRFLELGCGVGAALLPALYRLPEITVLGVEIDPALADLARQNLAQNNLATRGQILTADITTLTSDSVPERTPVFDAVFCNPPYLHPQRHRAPDPARIQAHMENPATPLADWIACADRLLRSRGFLTLIYRADRLHDLIPALAEKGFGSLRLLPIQPHADKPAHRLIIEVRKGGQSPDQLLPPLILHEADGRFTSVAQALFDAPTVTSLGMPAVD